MSGGWKSVDAGGKAQASDSYADIMEFKNLVNENARDLLLLLQKVDPDYLAEFYDTGGFVPEDPNSEYIQEKWSLFKRDSVAWLLSLDTNNFEKFLLEASEIGQAIRWRFKHGKSEN